MIIDVTVKRKNFYQFTAIKRDASGKIVSKRASDLFPNVFTNYGVETIFNADGTAGSPNPGELAAAVGTGSTAPAITQTLLAAFKAGSHSGVPTTASFVDLGDNQGYVEYRKTFLFPAGVATGIISEVGTSATQTAPGPSTPLTSRALVVDSGGSPTSFEVLSDEELELTIYLRNYVDYSQKTAEVTVNGVTHTLIWQPARLNNPSYQWPMPASFHIANDSTLYWGETIALANPTGSSLPIPQGEGTGSANMSQGVSGFLSTYVPNSKQRRANLRVGAGSAMNMVGAYFLVGALGSWQVGISPPVPKTTLQRFTIGMNFIVDNAP